MTQRFLTVSKMEPGAIVEEPHPPCRAVQAALFAHRKKHWIPGGGAREGFLALDPVQRNS